MENERSRCWNNFKYPIAKHQRNRGKIDYPYMTTSCLGTGTAMKSCEMKITNRRNGRY